MAEKTKNCPCSNVKSFEFLIGLKESEQNKNSDRSQIEKKIEEKCDKREVVGFEFLLFFSLINNVYYYNNFSYFLKMNV